MPVSRLIIDIYAFLYGFFLFHFIYDIYFSVGFYLKNKNDDEFSVFAGNTLDPARVFTAVALFNMLIMPLNAFPWVINGLVEAWVSLKRIERLMKVR